MIARTTPARPAGTAAATCTVAATALRSCLGDGAATFAALLAGRGGVGPLRHPLAERVHVRSGYHAPTADPADPARWLAECVAEVLAGADDLVGPIPVLVGTGLGRRDALERAAADPTTSADSIPTHPDDLDLAVHLRPLDSRLAEPVVVNNACSASGHALALAQDILVLGLAPAVVVAGTDVPAASMLAMIGRVQREPTERVRPFDTSRAGVLLGEGAAAVLLRRTAAGPVCGEVLATGLSCDAAHETAPHLGGIERAMRDALARAELDPADVDLVVAHGTGTELNDPVESAALRAVLVDGGGTPAVTAFKGAIGHTSGAAALMGVDLALRALNAGEIPPIVGLEEPLPAAACLGLVRGEPARRPITVAQVDAFGFGGVNSVTLLRRAA